MLPSDAQAWLNPAMNLEQSGVTAVAETAYQRQRVMTLDAMAGLPPIHQPGMARIFVDRPIRGSLCALDSQQKLCRQTTMPTPRQLILLPVAWIV